MNTQSINNRMYRIGALAGGAIAFGATFEPFIPLLIALAAGLIAGALLRVLFSSILNARLHRNYRYSRSASNSDPRSGPSSAEAASNDALVFYRNILGLDSGFTAAQLKTAYHECAARYHPDHFNNAPEKERRRACEMMKQINAAYQALSGA